MVSGNQTNIGAVNLNRDLRLEITPSKLLEATDGERLDTLSTGIAGDEDQEIRNWAPWLKSTGPKSPEGKARVARNCYRGG